MASLRLETKGQAPQPEVAPGIMITPALDEDFWAYRVVLSERQAIVGFPKFTTVGIGFAMEEDWNTNLPYTCDAHDIFRHIAHNKGDDTISDADCLAAIRLVQEAVKADRA
jgi:hypothetical protein